MDFEIIRKLGRESSLHKMTQKLSMVVRYALTDATKKVTLQEELDYLKAYVDIQ